MAVELGQADEGRNVALRKGDALVIRLPENPTTGFRWAMDRGGDLVTADGSDFAPTGAGVGGGGVRALRFRATVAGQAVLSLKRWRPWEGDASISARFTVVLHVTE
jgi:inhibitor of cysteine peptidase